MDTHARRRPERSGKRQATENRYDVLPCGSKGEVRCLAAAITQLQNNATISLSPKTSLPTKNSGAACSFTIRRSQFA